MTLLKIILNAIISFFTGASNFIGYFYKYRIVYTITGFFATRKFKKASQNHKYAVLISARNEETVIGNLIDSIRANDYPQELITIFVVADNCTDKTAEIARQKGAVCYERFDSERRTKGFALQFLMNKIKEDYGSVEAFEGYFVFDADNLLKKDYITRMNEAFDAGEKVITSYRASKNFEDNWIAASYAIHWLRTIRTENRARSVFRLACRIQGTGFLVASEVIPDGWNFTTLTEDRQLSAAAVVRGYRISYNNDAIFYDEQPTDLKTAWRQRLRWGKGHIQSMYLLGGKLFLNIFKFNKMSFISFDMLTTVWSRSLEKMVKAAIITVAQAGLLITAHAHFGEYLSLLTIMSGVLLAPYLGASFAALYVFIVEHKRIPKMPWYKKLWFCITFPIFDIFGKLSIFFALFMKIEWKPIPHTRSIKIEEIAKK